MKKKILAAILVLTMVVGLTACGKKASSSDTSKDSGSDMIIANGDDVRIVHDLVAGAEKGTLFLAHENLDFDLMDYINTKY